MSSFSIEKPLIIAVDSGKNAGLAWKDENGIMAIAGNINQVFTHIRDKVEGRLRVEYDPIDLVFYDDMGKHQRTTRKLAFYKGQIAEIIDNEWRKVNIHWFNETTVFSHFFGKKRRLRAEKKLLAIQFYELNTGEKAINDDQAEAYVLLIYFLAMERKND